jgi:processive 1,2-diacylglycerol beta-glucosyltransferase
MAAKTILLLSVPAGAGHTRVAEAIQAGGAARADTTIVHLDAMAYASPRLRRIYTDLYLLLIKRAPSVWSQVYRMTHGASPDGRMERLRRRIERRHCAPLVRHIAELRPDAIVCTHFQPAEILSQQIAAGLLPCPVWVQVTDFDLHRMWVHPHIAGYFAPNEEVAFRLRGQGIAAETVHVTGIPVMPAFAESARLAERGPCARALGLDPDVTTFLLMGGGAGLGGLSATARRLLAIPGRLQLIALAGRNAAELALLRQLAQEYPGRLAPLGYSNEVARLMACADLVITKPGGSTVAECLAMGLPMIVNAPIPGQEESNANFLVEQGAALKAFDLPTLEYRIRYLMAHPGKLDAMRASARALGRPQAAADVLDIVLGRDKEAQDDARVDPPAESRVNTEQDNEKTDVYF